ncbi:hypothetical protein SADUNF_Sadunf16G0088300 [Salix dunnii]|uniref:Uncharacterized protein n=1 Tax=Salix dunnii TaxID=1413687 RepID=A0A835J8P6_9ROSI|nr:hypothetical protein SADUNF_Sadunf16G0088300 [Salix dunnii]
MIRLAFSRITLRQLSEDEPMLSLSSALRGLNTGGHIMEYKLRCASLGITVYLIWEERKGPPLVKFWLKALGFDVSAWFGLGYPVLSPVTANGFEHLKEEYSGDMDFGKIWKELSNPDHVTSWDLVLPHAEFSFNNSVNRSTGCSPFEVVYDVRPNTPLDVNSLPLPPRPNEAALDFSSYMSHLHEECKRRLTISANSYATAANSHCTDRQFNEGDMLAFLVAGCEESWVPVSSPPFGWRVEDFFSVANQVSTGLGRFWAMDLFLGLHGIEPLSWALSLAFSFLWARPRLLT